MAIIFDLDMTLIDSSPVEHLRRSRSWGAVYREIPKLTPYPGIISLLNSIFSLGIPIAIVTNSPSSYCHRVLQHFGWEVDSTICYHDVRQRKPSPEPMLLAIKQMGVGANETISVGDRANDILSSQRAGIDSVGAFWGTEERLLLSGSRPTHSAESANELKKILNNNYGYRL